VPRCVVQIREGLDSPRRQLLVRRESFPVRYSIHEPVLDGIGDRIQELLLQTGVVHVGLSHLGRFAMGPPSPL